MTEWLDFASKISWPLVVLVAVIILGPGGVLQKIVGELAGKLLGVTAIVNEFTTTAANFERTIREVQVSTQWVKQLEDQLRAVSERLESINAVTQELAISDGNRLLRRSVDGDGAAPEAAAVPEIRSVEEMYAEIRRSWSVLTNALENRIGEGFDRRKIGEMAWKLVDGRRARPLTNSDAELIETLHSQWKRFSRLQSSKEDWLTHDIYAAFIRGVEQALAAL